eukprot:maker-scaffold76_size406464-snap-gene-3.13 protein:Tk10242 transcript:maker-scaffold76_size406464-snap-gene-3.13-mRNA-1 annotation:"PREDICTED: hypothetical protein LOC100748578"
MRVEPIDSVRTNPEGQFNVRCQTNTMFPVLALLCVLGAASASRPLARPELKLCQARISHFNHGGHKFSFSWLDPRATKLDWLDARNFCRQRCMDTTSIVSRTVWHYLKSAIELSLVPNMTVPAREEEDRVPGMWTSGRLCDFDGCERSEHVKPIHSKGWFWSSNNKKISNSECLDGRGSCFHRWSNSGKYGFPQPDSRELREEGIEGNESCLALLFKAYPGDQGLAWHDKACYHKMYFVCQDSTTLLRYARRKWRGARIP